jgi:hypothetical protein
VAGRSGADRVRARVHRNRQAELRWSDADAVAHDFQPGRGLRGRNRDGELGEPPLERLGAILRDALDVPVARLLRLGRGFEELAPRAGGPSGLLVAVGEVQDRPERGVELLTRFERRARAVVVTFRHLRFRFVEKSLSCGAAVCGLRARAGR